MTKACKKGNYPSGNKEEFPCENNCKSSRRIHENSLLENCWKPLIWTVVKMIENGCMENPQFCNDGKGDFSTSERVFNNTETHLETVVNCTGIIHTTLSDHSLVYCMMKEGIPKIPPKKFEYWSFKNYKSEFIKDLNQVPWSVVDGVENVNVAVFLWKNCFLR